jgi:hypothetical protein
MPVRAVSATVDFRGNRIIIEWEDGTFTVDEVQPSQLGNDWERIVASVAERYDNPIAFFELTPRPQ